MIFSAKGFCALTTLPLASNLPDWDYSLYLLCVSRRPAHLPTGITMNFFRRKLLRVTTLPLAPNLLTGIEGYLKGVCQRPAHLPTGITMNFFRRKPLHVTTLPLAPNLLTGIEAYLKGVCQWPAHSPTGMVKFFKEKAIACDHSPTCP